MKSLIKLVIAIAVIAFLWKQFGQKIQGSGGGSSTAGSSSSVEASCVSAAEAAGETWGSGVGKFANPPYDTTNWDDFRSRVEQQARSAEGKCLCSSESCNAAKTAMNDLRSLVNEMDSSIRSGNPPPSDLVQRQEMIDNGINQARDLVKQGK
jgi:hypothetical protein